MVGLVRDIFYCLYRLLHMAFRIHNRSIHSLPTNLNAATGPRVLVSTHFFLGLVYFCAIVKTLYGYGRVSEMARVTEAARGRGVP